MAEKKITKRERFEEIKVLVKDNPELVAFIDHEIELLARKGSKSATLSPAQKDNLAIAEIVKDILSATDKGMTVSALLKTEPISAYVCANGEGVSSQKMTSVISAMVKSGDAVRTVEKKVAYFTLAYGEVADEGEGE